MVSNAAVIINQVTKVDLTHLNHLNSNQFTILDNEQEEQENLDDTEDQIEISCPNIANPNANTSLKLIEKDDHVAHCNFSGLGIYLEAIIDPSKIPVRRLITGGSNYVFDFDKVSKLERNSQMEVWKEFSSNLALKLSHL
ncbi:hypothetical protein ACH5RR_002542 [Cinchona calisaya]|uniref:Uncharacterized protein n=1 Tax=Cinchona calisaya TaxID=153742 RepID=A0ABD3ASN3_9GENT